MKNTNWKDIAELVGIAAIVASLIALTLELRQTQLALSATTYQARALDSIADNRYAIESNYLLPLLVKTDRGSDSDAIDELSEIDQVRLRRYFNSEMADLDNEYYQYVNGFLDSGFFEDVTMRGIRRTAPLWRAYGMTEQRREFREFVDSVLEEQDRDSE
jgi:hypothetical protein